VLEPAPGERSRLHVRLRAATPDGRSRPLLELGGGLIDYATLDLMVRGLRERLSSE
jgi:hypothetical protein